MTAITSPSRLAALARTGRMYTPPEPAIDEIVHGVRVELRADAVMFNLIDATEHFAKSASDAIDAVRHGMRLPITATVGAAVVTSGQPRIIHDVRQLAATRELEMCRRLGFAAYLGVAVFAFNEPVGLLCALSRTPRFWPAEARALMEAAAARLTTLIETPDPPTGKHLGTEDVVDESD